MVLWKSFLSLHNFCVQKCKNHIFEENKGLSAVFFLFEVQVISNRSSGLEKKRRTPKILFMNDFHEFFKKANFPHFLIFSKIINCTY